MLFTEREWIELGPVPAAENCAPITDVVKSKQECKALIGQIRRECGDEPYGAELKTRRFTHNEGLTYYEVVCYYDPKNEEAEDYAFKCEEQFPEYWDAIAKKELGL